MLTLFFITPPLKGSVHSIRKFKFVCLMQKPCDFLSSQLNAMILSNLEKETHWSCKIMPSMKPRNKHRFIIVKYSVSNHIAMHMHTIFKNIFLTQGYSNKNRNMYICVHVYLYIHTYVCINIQYKHTCITQHLIIVTIS